MNHIDKVIMVIEELVRANISFKVEDGVILMNKVEYLGKAKTLATRHGIQLKVRGGKYVSLG